MTKKSLARVQRDKLDKEIDKNNCWDDLNEVSRSIRSMLVQHTAISALAQNKDLMLFLDNPSDTAASIRMLGKDLLEFNSRVVSIHDQHKDRSGKGTSLEDVLFSIQLTQEYSNLASEHNTIIAPTAYKILEDFDRAEKKMAIANSAELVAKEDTVTETEVAREA